MRRTSLVSAFLILFAAEAHSGLSSRPPESATGKRLSGFAVRECGFELAAVALRVKARAISAGRPVYGSLSSRLVGSLRSSAKFKQTLFDPFRPPLTVSDRS
jgi:hypothetical protein